MRSIAHGDGRMPRPGLGTVGGLARPHPGAAGAVVVHVPPRDAVAAGTGRGFRRGGGSRSAGDGIVRARRLATDALGRERSGDTALIGVGGAGAAWSRLPVPASLELAAAPWGGRPGRPASVRPRGAG